MLPPAELTGTAGGSLTWTGAYDASFGRFAWHDPLDDLAADPTLGGALPDGPEAGAATYLVVGWWSDPALDPLDGVRTTGGLAERTAELGWRVVTGGGAEHTEQQGPLGKLAELGLPVRDRLQEPTSSAFRRAAIGVENLGRPAFQASTVAAYQSVGALSIANEAGRWVTGRGIGVEASTLMHGAVVSVPLPPVGASLDVDLRPPRGAVRLTLGDHVDDLVAASVGAGAGQQDGPPDRDARAAVERLLSALSAGLVARLADPDGLVEMDERAHAAGFAAVDPGEPALVDRVLTGRAAIPPRPPRPQASAAGGASSTLVFLGEPVTQAFAREEPAISTQARAQAFTPPPRRLAEQVTARVSPVVARTTIDPGPPAAGVAASRATQPGEQLVERPAPRRYVPIDPVVGVLGARRGLRHGGDGRGDPDERLGCRRGSQVVSGYTGLVSRQRPAAHPRQRRGAGRDARARPGGPAALPAPAPVARRRRRPADRPDRSTRGRPGSGWARSWRCATTPPAATWARRRRP